MEHWIGVDFDATLAVYTGWDNGKLGEPIPAMIEVVKGHLNAGQKVKIFTARVACTGHANDVGGVDDKLFCDAQRELIAQWCEKHIGQRLEVTATKDFGLMFFYDDRAIRVEPNTGRIL